MVCAPLPTKFEPLGVMFTVALPPRAIDMLVSEPNGTSAPNTPCPNGEADTCGANDSMPKPTAKSANPRYALSYTRPIMLTIIPQRLLQLETCKSLQFWVVRHFCPRTLEQVSGGRRTHTKIQCNFRDRPVWLIVE